MPAGRSGSTALCLNRTSPGSGFLLPGDAVFRLFSFQRGSGQRDGELQHPQGAGAQGILLKDHDHLILAQVEAHAL